ncbi:ParA family protein [Candidatus Poriferisodalis sp.]|uniref:ParA family protein n=1 Tax=Candidatus Poriferisodalis sp. TaxID=3101277 RepID=UPI003AF4BA8B
MTAVAFFNNKGGVGKTSLVYHLAWMFADLGVGVVAADLDPQANLTSMFLDENEMERLWASKAPRDTVSGALVPLIEGLGDISPPKTLMPRPGISLVPGDLSLSRVEDQLSSQWPLCLDDDQPRAFRVITALSRILQHAQRESEADLALIDVGPNLGAINRAALIAADHVVVPLAPDLFSLQGLRNLGPTLVSWRNGWKERLDKAAGTEGLDGVAMPSGAMQPIGYVVQQHAVRLDRPVKAYARWMDAIPNEYRTAVLKEADGHQLVVENDEHCLGLLRNYRSLMPYAQDARKPMFFLRAADGAVGGHVNAVRDCYDDFRNLACAISDRIGVRCPQLD